ncbi:alpha/beta fold hydrolase [Propylenella binzhouense]|nr:alpha/beta fold hydrolase [Propylenella binzhouense]
MEGRFPLPDGAELFYRIDDFTDPWRKAPPVLMLHGFGESHEAWRAWVPHLARDYPVIRVDRRGFGASTPAALDHPWTIDGMAEDVVALLEGLAGEPAHIVAAKIAVPIAIRTAARRPGLVRSLTLLGGAVTGPDGTSSADMMAREGIRAWAEATMDERMGPDMEPAAKAWWIALTARSPASTMIGFMRHVAEIDVRDDLGRVAAPTLALSTDSARRPIAQITGWLRQIPDARFVPVPGAGYHTAATSPDFCAAETLRFLREVDGAAPQVSRPLCPPRPGAA